MEELLQILIEIKNELVDMNLKLDTLTDYGTESLGNINASIEGIKGNTKYDLTDIHGSLDNIESALSIIDLSISMLD